MKLKKVNNKKPCILKVARVRPAVFVTSVAREIARYNNLVRSI